MNKQKFLDFFEGNEFAASTFINKYVLKDKNGNLLESSPDETIHRVMKVLSNNMPSNPSNEWLLKNNFPPDVSWLDVFIEGCNKFKGICPQGSILSAAGDDSFLQSLSNCFVIPSPEDSIKGIFETGEQEAQLMKRRAGVGIDISTLRPEFAMVQNAAKTSSGAVGWMDYFSNVCRSIGQNNRRGALMITLDIKHPDAEEFAKIKRDLKKVTGANISLKLTDAFMNAVQYNEDYIQQFPIDADVPLITKKIKAKDLWKTIIESAHMMAEPGLIFWDNCLKNLPLECYEGFKSIAVNPCSEIILSNDSCRLTTICLTNYVKNRFIKDSYFDFVLFERDIRIAMRLMDAVVTAEIAQIEKILTKIRSEESANDKINEITMWEKLKQSAINGRRTGLGTHGLGDCLSQLCIRYDSKDALEVVDKIYSKFRNVAYDESIEMAKEYGPFPIYDFEKEKDCEFIKRLPKDLLDKMKKHGRRNGSLLTCAPSGSISIISQVSSGIEPTFRQMFTRRRKINANEKNARVDFVDELGDKWTEFPQFEKNVVRYFEAQNKEVPKNIRDDEELSEHLPHYFITSDKINWKKRIEIQSIMQSYLDHSISSTINLPSNASVETVSQLYQFAWEKGLKGITVYRDGCRSGVLITNSEKKKDRPEKIERIHAPKRPERLPCEVHITKVKGEEYVVIVGFFNGSVYEVFFGKHNNHIPTKQFSGFIEKKGRSAYLLKYHRDDIEQSIDINKYFDNEDYACATRLLSMSLRHHTPLEYITEQLQKSSKSLVEFGSAVSRILKKYIKLEDLQKGAKCEVCDSKDVQIKNEDGCITIICNHCNIVNSKCN